MSYVMGIDVGTTGCKVVLFETKQKTIKRAYEEYKIDVPRSGWAEQNPEVWWSATKRCIRKVLTSFAINPKNVQAIGLCGQMHTHVLLDGTLRPLRAAITWMDQRSVRQVEKLKKEPGNKFIFDNTANFPTTTYTLPQLLWVKEREPEVFARARKVVIAKDYVKFKLTGRLSTDLSEASGTLFFDVCRKKWSVEMLKILGLSENFLPELTCSTDIIGKVTPGVARQTGLKSGTPVVSGAGDCAAEAIAEGVIEEGQTGTVIGTAGVIYVCTTKPFPDPNLRLLCWSHAVDGRWMTLGVMQTAGSSLRWFRDNFGKEEMELATSGKKDVYEIFNQMAQRIDPGCGGLIFLPYLMGERSPHWDPDARGVFYGFSMGHTKAHFIRAIMEGVAFAIRNNAEIIENLGVKIKRVYTVGGGSKSRLWRQIQADVMGKVIVRTNLEEEAALGAAILAGVGVGLYDTITGAVKDIVKIKDIHNPDRERCKQYEKYYKIYKELYSSLRPVYKKMSRVLKSSKNTKQPA